MIDCCLTAFKALLERLNVQSWHPPINVLEVGHLNHIVLAQFWQHLINIVVEQLVGAEQNHLAGRQIATITIQQPSHAL